MGPDREPLDSLAGRVALVTGSSRGLGRAIARGLARAGANVVVTYRARAAEAEELACELSARGAQASCCQLDVASRESVHSVVQTTLDRFGRLDILVNNAGILQQKPFLAITDEDWDATFQTNLKGAFVCSQEALPIMQRQESGCVVNLSSVGGQIGGPLAVHYSASKAGVISMTRSLARIAAPHIRVNCLAPGLIDTEMTHAEIASEAGQQKIRQIPLKRPGSPDEVANMVCFLASDRASYITGQTFNVNGGQYFG